MTPAINILKKRKINYKVHQYKHDVNCQSYGLEAAEKLQVEPARVFKTLVVDLDGAGLAVAVIPVAAMLNMKLIAKAAGAKKAAMADKDTVSKTTGYVLGGVSPLGQKKRLPTFIDASGHVQTTIFVSGGKRGLDIELSPQDLATLTGASFQPLTAEA
jgi:Cys-tRNA(Pro)/Cys-tRNA(Cys) deacylase